MYSCPLHAALDVSICIMWHFKQLRNPNQNLVKHVIKIWLTIHINIDTVHCWILAINTKSIKKKTATCFATLKHFEKGMTVMPVNRTKMHWWHNYVLTVIKKTCHLRIFIVKLRSNKQNRYVQVVLTSRQTVLTITNLCNPEKWKNISI